MHNNQKFDDGVELVMERFKKRNRNIKAIIFSIICCLVIIFLPLPIANIVVGIEHMDDDCQKADPIGLSLSNWLLGMGIYGLSNIVVTILSYGISVCLFGKEAAKVVVTLLVIVNDIFCIIYTTIGGIILFRNNGECLNSALGELTLATLIIHWIAILLSILSSICECRKYMSDYKKIDL